MSRGDPRLVFLALCALHEAVEECEKAPVVRTVALRVALAYLFNVSDGTRWPYDQLWRDVGTDMREIGRQSSIGGQALSALKGIMRSLGQDPSSLALHRLAEWRKRQAPDLIAARRMARAIRDEQKLRWEREEHQRQYHG